MGNLPNIEISPDVNVIVLGGPWNETNASFRMEFADCVAENSSLFGSWRMVRMKAAEWPDRTESNSKLI